MSEQKAIRATKGSGQNRRNHQRRSGIVPSGREEELLALQDAVGNQAVSSVTQPGGENSSSITKLPLLVQRVLQDNGQPLEPETRAELEAKFGEDLSGVRVHTDAQAVESAETVNAEAYTVGKDIVFAAGEYKPEDSAGKRLLSHELAHVIQQSRGGTKPPVERSAVHEHNAVAAATAVVGGRASVGVKGATGVGLARQAKRTSTGQFREDQIVAVKLPEMHLLSELSGDPGSKLVAVLKKGDQLKLGVPHPRGGGKVFYATVIKSKNTENVGKTGIIPTSFVRPSTEETDLGPRHAQGATPRLGAGTRREAATKGRVKAEELKKGDEAKIVTDERMFVPLDGSARMALPGARVSIDATEQARESVWVTVKVLPGQKYAGKSGKIRAEFLEKMSSWSETTKVVRLEELGNVPAERETDPLPLGKDYQSDPKYIDNIHHTSYDVATGDFWLVYEDGSRIELNYATLKRSLQSSKAARTTEERSEALSQEKVKRIAERHGVTLPKGQASVTTGPSHRYVRHRKTGQIWPLEFTEKTVPNLADAVQQIETIRGDAELLLQLGRKMLEIPIIGPIAAPRSATRGLFGTGARGLQRLTPSARRWLARILKDPRKIISFIRAGDDIVDAVNRFHGVKGFEQVVQNYVAGGNLQKGARLVMRFVQANFKKIPPDMAFEVASPSRARIMDLIADGVKYEFKSVSEIRKAIVVGKGQGRQIGQLQRDLELLLAQAPLDSGKLRWVFDKTEGLSRSHIINAMEEHLRQGIFRNDPRLNDIINMLHDIVMVW